MPSRCVAPLLLPSHCSITAVPLTVWPRPYAVIRTQLLHNELAIIHGKVKTTVSVSLTGATPHLKTSAPPKTRVATETVRHPIPLIPQLNNY